MAYVYRHIRLDKNIPFYIGVGHLHSDDHYKRLGRTYGRNNIWKKIVNKTEYIAEILLDDLTYEEALQKEIEFIKLYGRINNKTGILSNLTDGGEGSVSYIATDETRKKLSNVWKGRKQTPEHIRNRTSSLIGIKRPKWIIDKMSESRRGIHLSKEHREAISKCTKGDKNPFYGKQHSIESMKSVSKQVIDIDSGNVYNSIKEASVSLNMSYGMLKMMLRGVRKNKTTLKYYTE